MHSLVQLPSLLTSLDGLRGGDAGIKGAGKILIQWASVLIVNGCVCSSVQAEAMIPPLTDT